MSATQIIKAKMQTMTTDELWSILETIDAKVACDEADRAISAAASDLLESRLDLSARMDVIYADDDFAGNYTEALRMAAKMAA